MDNADVVKSKGTEFASSVPYGGQWGDTLAIYCSDPRFRQQTLEFLQVHLGLHDPAVITIPAGVAPLLPLVGLAHKLAKGWLDVLIRKHRPARIVCVAHEDCAGYKHGKNPILNFALEQVTGGDAADLQRKHLLQARGTLRTWFPGVAVEAYYAAVKEDSAGVRQVVFTPVE